MKYRKVVKGSLQAALQSPRLPAVFDELAHQTATEIDGFLTRDKRSATALDAKVAAHREAGLAQLSTLGGKLTLDPAHFRWPPYLFIPKNANARDYWITGAPDDHRYSLDWTSPVTATANRASRLDGTLFSFSQLLNETPKISQSSASGVGVFYTPPMSLGVIDLQPQVNCSGTLRTFLEFFPKLAAGYVEIWADLVVSAWQQIPGGFDLLGFKVFDVATSGRRDQTHGPELRPFQRSFSGSNLSAPFVVQGGRTYLLGVVGRINVTSTLTANTAGGALPPFNNNELRVWGSMNCVVPEIDVFTKRIDIP